MNEVIDSLSYNEKKILLILKELKSTTPQEILKTGGFTTIDEVMSACSWLKAKGFVEFKEEIKEYYSLGKEGEEYIKNGLPEKTFVSTIIHTYPDVTTVLKFDDIKFDPDKKGIAIKWAKEKNWIEMKKNENGVVVVTPTPLAVNVIKNGIKGEDEKVLQELSVEELPGDALDPKGLAMLKKRQNVVTSREVVKREISLTKLGQEVLTSSTLLKEKFVESSAVLTRSSIMFEVDEEKITEITHDIIRSGKWKTAGFRKYDINAPISASYSGKFHPLKQMIHNIRQIFLEMGFKEVEYDYVVSCFWDMDVLFIPQDHPAREMQDTFYVEGSLPLPNKALVQRIAKVHENGGNTGSKGWGQKWNGKEAQKAILRTHTTVNTIKYLAENPVSPVRIFSIGRVFRREAIDSTHLPEFYQIEGIIMEEHANFNMLVGILKEFYKRIGFENVRFRPGYFPYTEPSLEVEVYFNGKWMELGGAGMFRPEVTLPLGLKHRVLAWGLGLERLAMLKFGLNDIRDLYISDIDWLRKRAI